MRWSLDKQIHCKGRRRRSTVMAAAKKENCWCLICSRMLLLHYTSISAKIKSALFAKLIWISESFFTLSGISIWWHWKQKSISLAKCLQKRWILHDATSHWVKELNKMYGRAADDSDGNNSLLIGCLDHLQARNCAKN